MDDELKKKRGFLATLSSLAAHLFWDRNKEEWVVRSEKYGSDEYQKSKDGYIYRGKDFKKALDVFDKHSEHR